MKWIKEDFTYNMLLKDKREIRKIIFQNFDSLTDSRNNFFNREHDSYT